MKYFKTCPICGTAFSAFKSELETRKTCSEKCGYEYRSRSHIDWEPIAVGLAERHKIEYYNEITTFMAVYPAIYKSRIELAEVVGVAVNTLDRYLKRIGVAR